MLTAMNPRILLRATLTTFAALALIPAQDPDADWAALTEGVEAIAVAGVPGPLCVFGEAAFPVVLARSGEGFEPVVAAARPGRGRVLAFGHNGYLDPGVGGMERFHRNALRWLAAGAERPRVAVRRLPRLRRLLQGAGCTVEELDVSSEVRPALVALDGASLRAREVPILRRWVEEGTGLLTASLGWGWMQLNRGKDLRRDHPGNRLLGPWGLVWADGTLEATGEEGIQVARPPAFAHAARAWEGVVDDARAIDPPERALALAVLTRAARSLPRDDRLLRPQLRAQLRDAPPLPTAKRPLGPEHLRARTLVAFELDEIGERAAGEVEAHPAAADFPGAVPSGAPRARVRRTLDTSIPGWHSLGLYAPPGELLHVTVSEIGARAGLHLRIGCHEDRVWRRPRWTRMPEITRVWPIDRPAVDAAGAFGGLLYVVVPPRCPAGALEITIEGAIAAPLFIAGVTDPEEWRTTLRHHPAPWAEIGSRRVIVTVPSTSVRELDDPVALMETWDRILALDEELCGRSAAAARPERIVCDRQISAGYMHAGYPIMVHMDQQRNLVDRDHLLAGNWGLFHELGHNHQHRDWTFAGTGEVTCNLFSLYVFEKLCGVGLQDPRSRMSPERRIQRTADWDSAAPDFARWKSDPFLALVMYAEIAEVFGWEVYHKVLREYLALPDSERPKNDDQKRDQWLVRLSRATGHDLAPYFATWGVPTSTTAQQQVADLPTWLPER